MYIDFEKFEANGDETNSANLTVLEE